MVSHYENLKSFFEETFPRVDKYTRKHRRVIKYVIAGGTAAATNIGSLFILVHFFSIYYLVAAVASWTISFCVSFALQKFWTFGSRNLDKAHKELVIYFTVSIASLVVDTYLLYLFVEFLHIHYLISQIVIGLATAVVTYSINKFIIFKKHNTAGGHVILIAAANYPPDPGGPATHAQKYVEEFSAAGHEVRVVVFSRLYWLPVGLRHVVYSLLVFRKALGADVIYLQDPISSGPAAYVARLMRKPYSIRIGGDVIWERAAEHGETVLSCREFYTQGKHAGTRFFGVVQSVIRHARRIVVPSPLLVDIYSTYYQVPKERIALIPNPLPGPRALHPHTERSVVFASRLVRYKNLQTVIDACTHLDATFYILGDGPERAELEARSSELGARTKILGTVSRKEKDEYLKKCMLTIAPAWTEFNPNYVLEGFAMGKPTLMSRENGLPFALPDYMLFDPHDAGDLTRKMQYLLSEVGYREAETWVRNLAYTQTWKDVVTENLKIISEVCAF